MSESVGNEVSRTAAASKGFERLGTSLARVRDVQARGQRLIVEGLEALEEEGVPIDSPTASRSLTNRPRDQRQIDRRR